MSRPEVVVLHGREQGDFIGLLKEAEIPSGLDTVSYTDLRWRQNPLNGDIGRDAYFGHYLLVQRDLVEHGTEDAIDLLSCAAVGSYGSSLFLFDENGIVRESLLDARDAALENWNGLSSHQRESARMLIRYSLDHMAHGFAEFLGEESEDPWDELHGSERAIVIDYYLSNAVMLGSETTAAAYVLALEASKRPPTSFEEAVGDRERVGALVGVDPSGLDQEFYSVEEGEV